MSWIDSIPIAILKLIYPLKEPNRARDRPLEVLALGHSRPGTESLRHAFIELGYSEVHHGFYVVDPANSGECIQFVRLGKAKFRDGNSAFLNAKEFEKAIGNCMALTDLPTAAFGIELLRVYPDAKVILNKRDDVDAWYKSTMSTVARLNGDWAS